MKVDWHGVVVLLLDVLSGAVVPILANLRMGPAANLGGMMDGMLLILLGLL